MQKNCNNPKILIGKKLKEARHSLGYTQEYVAEKLGLAPRYLSDLERDKTKGSIDTLVKLCNIYNITPTYVLSDFINSSSEIQVDPSLVGFYKLSAKDKEVVRELICFMNKQNNN